MRKDIFGERYAPLTIDDIEAMDKATLAPWEVAEVIGCKAYDINVKFKEGKLEFPAIQSGNRVKVLREPFIRFVRTGK